MRLLFDAMLRNTAKWARIFGVDSQYLAEEDKTLIKSAFESGRILITMDKELSQKARKAGVKIILLSTFDVSEQLYDIERVLGKEIFMYPDKTRCTVCNGRLKKAKIEEVRDKLPEKVENFQKEFWVCEDCGKVYWEGGHWKNIKKTYEELKKKRTSSK